MTQTDRQPMLAGRAGTRPDLATLRLSDGTVLAALCTGNASERASAGVVVVLVHGWTQDHTSWDDVVASLDASHPELPLVAYDARGHGWSDAGPRGSASIDQLADDLAEVCAQLVPDGAGIVLAGHSLGGPVIMAFAERHPDVVRDRVRGIAFVATSAARIGTDLFGLSSRLTAPALLVAPVATRLRSWSRASQNLRHPAPLAAFLRLGFYGPGGAVKRNRARTAAQTGRSHPATTAQLVDEMVRHDRLHSLSELDRTPTAVLAGTKDGLCPMAHSRAIAEAMPRAELVVYPGAGHMLPYERPDDVAEQIARLAGVRG